MAFGRLVMGRSPDEHDACWDISSRWRLAFDAFCRIHPPDTRFGAVEIREEGQIIRAS
jgi:hypothetical protein